MRFIVFTFVIISLLFSTPSAQAANRALLVGIGDYQIKGADLPGIDKDVNMVRDVALKLGYKKDDIKVLLNKDATLKNIQNAINTWLIQGVTENDQVLFYFSGHGSQIFDKNKDEADRADEVLVTHDSSLGARTLNNVLVDDMFNEMLEKIPSENIFILIDACHSGTATRSISSNVGVTPKFLEYPGMPRTTRSVNFASKSIQNLNEGYYSALSAAQDNQRAQASSQGSFFTLGVSESIQRVSKKQRTITMLALHDQVTDFIATQMPDPKLVHRPALVGGLASNQKNLFISKDTKPQRPQKKKWAEDLLEIKDKAAFVFTPRTNGYNFKVGEQLVITCSIKKSGYVNIITMQPGDEVPTVLFPNKFHKDNWVEAGKTLAIPGPGDTFALAAAPPTGKALVAAFISPFKVNFYEQGYGEGAFKMMSRTSTRGFVVTAASTPEQVKPDPPTPEPAQPAPQPVEPKPREYGAGIVFVRIN